MTNTPFVIEQGKNGERVYDLYSRLLEDRTIFIGEEVTDSLANSVIAQLLFLDGKDHKTIKLYINSPGGCITAGLGILDTMRYIKSDVMTVCVGRAASMGAILLSAGTKGKRFALPNSRIMIHEPQQYSTGIPASATDIELDTKLLLDMREQCLDLLCEATGKPRKAVRIDCQRDKWMRVEEALDYGLIDAIISEKPDD
jgi:ATP-dependent Clp protease protease subunit